MLRSMQNYEVENVNPTELSMRLSVGKIDEQKKELH